MRPGSGRLMPAQHLRDLRPEELNKAAESYFSQMQPAS